MLGRIRGVGVMVALLFAALAVSPAVHRSTQSDHFAPATTTAASARAPATVATKGYDAFEQAAYSISLSDQPIQSNMTSLDALERPSANADVYHYTTIKTDLTSNRDRSWLFSVRKLSIDNASLAETEIGVLRL